MLSTHQTRGPSIRHKEKKSGEIAPWLRDAYNNISRVWMCKSRRTYVHIYLWAQWQSTIGGKLQSGNIVRHCFRSYWKTSQIKNKMAAESKTYQRKLRRRLPTLLKWSRHKTRSVVALTRMYIVFPLLLSYFTSSSCSCCCSDCSGRRRSCTWGSLGLMTRRLWLFIVDKLPNSSERRIWHFRWNRCKFVCRVRKRPNCFQATRKWVYKPM
jgi:hypothetical protein